MQRIPTNANDPKQRHYEAEQGDSQFRRETSLGDAVAVDVSPMQEDSATSLLHPSSSMLTGNPPAPAESAAPPLLPECECSCNMFELEAEAERAQYSRLKNGFEGSSGTQVCDAVSVTCGTKCHEDTDETSKASLRVKCPSRSTSATDGSPLSPEDSSLTTASTVEEEPTMDANETETLSFKRRNLQDRLMFFVFGLLVAAAGLTACAMLAPGDNRNRELLVSILSDVTTEGALLEETSPQYKALEWMANEWNHERGVLEQNSARIVQRYALAVLYYSTGGTSWTHQYSFLSKGGECSWNNSNGPTRRHRSLKGWDGASLSFVKGVSCDSNGLVTEIDLSANNLANNIPSEVGKIASLLYIYLDSNSLSGQIPSSIGEITSLDRLVLSRNMLTGSVPTFLQSSLTYLSLSANNLVGEIPKQIGELTRLRYLGLLFNDLSGTVPRSFTRLTSAIDMRLHGNNITGSVDFLCEALDNLEAFRVDLLEVNCSCCSCCAST